jgi:pSer/pThr/pTyr-binding forkhead associated (FHA) protein
LEGWGDCNSIPVKSLNLSSISSIINSLGHIYYDQVQIDAAKIADLASGSAHLVVRRGALEGMQFPLLPGELMSIGRSSDSKIFLDDVTVSRKHASVSLSGSDWVLTDAGSLNGTYVNKMRVSSTTLVNGDELQIGKFRFIFVLAPSAGH